MNFDLQPHLAGSHIELRPLKSEDFEALYLAASDPLIWEQHPQNTRYKRDVFAEYFKSALESNGAFVAIDPISHQIIGSTRYYDYDSAKKQIAIGFTFLTRKYWGHVHNKEMKHLLLNHAFHFVESVIFHIGANNIRSQKAILKIGARLTSEIENCFPGGPAFKEQVYEIKKQLFLNSKNP